MDRDTKTEARSGSNETSGSEREPVRVKLLGGFSVMVGARTVDGSEWRLRKAAALVKLLALAPDHRLHREQVMDTLWPQLGKGAASNNPRRTLYTARRVLGPSDGSRYLASGEGWLGLCPEGSLWVDVDAFEAAAAAARRECEPAAYRAALELYAGELLPADRYEAWAEEKRGEIRRLRLDLLVQLAEACERRGEYAGSWWRWPSRCSRSRPPARVTATPRRCRASGKTLTSSATPKSSHATTEAAFAKG